MSDVVHVPRIPGEPVWGTETSAMLRAWLMAPFGQLFLRRLEYARPKVTERLIPKVRRIQSDERAGWEGCIDEILALASPTAITAEDRSAQTPSLPQ